MMLRIPLASLPPGRGTSPGFQLTLNYNSKLYDSHIEEIADPGTGQIIPQIYLNPSEQGGWHYNSSAYYLQLVNRIDTEGWTSCDPTNCFSWLRNAYRYKLKVIFPDAGEHEFRPLGYTDSLNDGYYDIDPNGLRWGTTCNSSSCQISSSQATTAGMTYYSTDGTFIRLDIAYSAIGNWAANWTLTFPDGTKVVETPLYQRTYDRNNSYTQTQSITYNGNVASEIVDELGRSIIVEHTPSHDFIHVTGPNGEDVISTVTWKTIYAYKPYRAETSGTGRGNVYPTTGSNTPTVVDQIILPSQAGSLAYTFAYNAPDSDPYPNYSYGWGEISAVTLPSGAQASYAWTFDDTGVSLHDPLGSWVLQDAVTRKDLTYTADYDGNSTPVKDTWTYSAPMNYGTSMTITGPDGSVTRNYSANSGPFARQSYKTENPDGSMVERIWQQNIPYQNPPMNAGVNPYIKTEFTSLKSGAGTFLLTAIKDYTYDKNGNVTQVKEYDWVDFALVHPAGGGPVVPAGLQPTRVTLNTFYNSTPEASITSYNANVYNQPTAPQIRKVSASTQVSDNLQPLSRTEFFYDNPTTTANVTQVKSWDSTKGAYSNPLSSGNSISVSTQYNSYGGPILVTDAKGVQTQIMYDAVGGFTDLYPTQQKTAYGTAVQRTESREYSFSTGLVKRVTDVDNNVSSSMDYDALGRPTLARAAEGKPEESRTTTEYSDLLRRVIVRHDLELVGDAKVVTVHHYDQLGRVRLTRRLEDASQSATDETTGIKTQTRYLTSGSACYVLTSNPYRATTTAGAASEVTMGWTRTKSDNTGRAVETQTFGGAALPAPWGPNVTSTGVVSTVYDGNFTTVTDQAGKIRRSMNDGLGRLARVDEPDSSSSLGSNAAPVQPTSYTYDALNNLTIVNQGIQSRTFVYDSFKRLTSATNPESGTVGYVYDNNSNLVQRTDARGVVSTYDYDALNRNKTIDYSDTVTSPDVSQFYDGATYGKGKLWYSYSGGTDTVGSNVEKTLIDTYDALGRPKSLQQSFKFNGVWKAPYQVLRTYNLAGAVVSQTYPSQRTIAYSFDAAGRASALAGNLGDGNNRIYSTGISYAPGGQLQQEQFGTAAAVYNKIFYNSRQQLSEILTSTTVGDTWNRGKIVNEYSLQCSGAACNATDNNGNIRKQEVYIPLDEQNSSSTSWYQQYDYDELDRLKRVHEYTGNVSLDWQQDFLYDRWGNRRIDTDINHTFGTGINNKGFEKEDATNRLYAPGDLALADSLRQIRYDAAGNQTKDAYTGYGNATFNAENRIVQIQDGLGGTSYYTYNGSGQRTRRNAGNQETWLIYGFDGELLAEYASAASAISPQKEYGYRNGELLVTAAPSDRGAGSGTAENVTWTNVVGSTPSGNSLTKTASTGWGNAGASSTRSIISGDGYVEFKVTSLLTGMVALSHTDANQDYTSMEFALLPNSDGNLYVFESGVNRGSFGSYTTSDVFRVAVEGGVVKYRKNGMLVYTSIVTPTYPLLADVGLYHNGGTFSNVVISGNLTGGITENVTWTNVVGSTASGNSLTKTASTGWGNAGASSTRSIVSGDGYVEFKVTSLLTGMVALSHTDANQDYTSMEFALLPNSDGNLYVFESGVNRGSFGSYTTSDVFRVAVEGGVVKYRKNGTLVYTSTVSPTYPLLADAGLYHNHGTFSNVVISGNLTGSPPESVAWTNVVGVNVAGNSLTKTASTGWGNAGASSTRSIVSGDGYVEFKVTSLLTGMVALSHTDANQDYTSMEFALLPNSDGNLYVFESGVNRGSFGSYTTSDVFRVAVEGGVVKYRKNGTLVYTSTVSPTYPLLADAGLYHNGGSFSDVIISGNLTGGGSGVQLNWIVSDQVGTPRMIFDESGSLANVKRHDYLPFGEELSTQGLRSTPSMGYLGSDGLRQRFTSQERDAETGLDYFINRYHSSTQGRFTSPDPLLASAKFSDPQSWNRYSYCRNNPVINVDPLGLLWYHNEQTNEVKWYESDPGGNWKQWNQYSYYAGEQYGWVALDPRSSHYETGFETQEDAGAYTNAMEYVTAMLQDPPHDPHQFDNFMQMQLMLGPVDIAEAGATALGEEGAELLAEEGLEVGLKTAAAEITAETAQVILNRAAGKEAEAIVAKELEAEGYTILGSQVGVRTSEGLRFVDHLVQDPAGNLIAIEVKSGGGTRNALQVAKDLKMATEGATIVSKKVPQLLGQTKVIPTVVRTPK